MHILVPVLLQKLQYLFHNQPRPKDDLNGDCMRELPTLEGKKEMKDSTNSNKERFN